MVEASEKPGLARSVLGARKKKFDGRRRNSISQLKTRQDVKTAATLMRCVSSLRPAGYALE